MPFIPNTPESLLGRSDSKNPNSTCRGITSSGRPCRRPVAASAAQTLLPRSRKSRISDHNPRDETLYCWQHKEQASLSTRSSPGPRATATPILEERTSLDTLADRLGLVELEQRQGRKQKRPHDGRAVGNRPAAGGSKPAMMARPKPKKQLHFCFCFKVPLEEVHDSPPPRPQPRPLQAGRPAHASLPTNQHLTASNSRPRPSISNSSPGRSSQKSARQLTGSQTARYLSLIAPDTEPLTASALMTELARPYVDSEEAGYIYMFWMTPAADHAAPPVEAARSLLAPPSPAGGASRQRRPSDVVSSFANASGRSKKKTMLLKIGRAQNVQRRMQQWSKQCGYEIEVIRYYPYIPGASEASGMSPRMAPHCHRVERLIHIELAGMGLHASRETCDACGRDHREWFEVQATREGIRAVDEVIRRWVDWDETTV